MSRIKAFITDQFSGKFKTDTIWLLMGQVALMLGGFGINLIVGIKQGSSSLGVFNQSVAYYSILATIIALGLNNTMVKKISEVTSDRVLESHILTSTLVITATVSVTLSLVFAGVSVYCPFLFSSSELAGSAIITFYALPLFNLNKNFMAYYAGKREQRKNATNKIIRWSLLFIYIVLASYFTTNVRPLLYSFFVVELIIFIVNVSTNWKEFNFNFNFDFARRNFLFGIKTFVAEIISVFYEYIDLILIGYFLSNSEVGIYSFLILFVKTLYIFPGIIQQNINPIISKLWKGQQIEELAERLGKVRRVNFIVVSAQVIIVLIFYKLVILFVKQEFRDSYFYFLLALPGVFLFSLIAWGGAILVMTNKIAENNYRTIVTIVLSVSSTLIMTYYFRLTGACLAVSINAMVSFFVTRGFVNRILHIKMI